MYLRIKRRREPKPAPACQDNQELCVMEPISDAIGDGEVPGGLVTIDALRCMHCGRYERQVERTDDEEDEQAEPGDDVTPFPWSDDQ